MSPSFYFDVNPVREIRYANYWTAYPAHNMSVGYAVPSRLRHGASITLSLERITRDELRVVGIATHRT